MTVLPAPSRTRWRVGSVLAAVFGLALFAYTLRETGLEPVLEGFRRVGAAFLLIVVLSGLRLAARAWAWILCTDRPHALRLRDTFPALVTGDALGNLTPLGLVVSEVTKAAFVRHRVSLMGALAGIAIENLFYVLTVAAVIAGGTVVLLGIFDVPGPMRVMSLAALVAMVGFIVVALALASGRFRPLTQVVTRLEGWWFVPQALTGRLGKLQLLEDRVYTFAQRNPSVPGPVLLLEGAYHALGVAEVYLTVALITDSAPATLLTAFLLESLNRFINVAFKFVPLRLGVDEAGTGLLAQVLGYGSAVGVTLALVRKARMLVWTAVGVAFLTARGLRPQDSDWGQVSSRTP
jgi:hypothetical protein